MYTEATLALIKRIKEIHDVDYGQKYAGVFPYSQHLTWVHSVSVQFKNLLKGLVLDADTGAYWDDEIAIAAYGHDLLEDTNMTYNDLCKLLGMVGWYKGQAKRVAETIYNLTDEKGRNRAERKNDKYYEELRQNPLAVYIKLCDIAANTMFSRLNGSDMYAKYKAEFPKFKEKVYDGNERFWKLFDYVENL